MNNKLLPSEVSILSIWLTIHNTIHDMYWIDTSVRCTIRAVYLTIHDNTCDTLHDTLQNIYDTILYHVAYLAYHYFTCEAYALLICF